MKIEFTVTYTIDLTSEDIRCIQLLCQNNAPARACKYIMNTYNTSLFNANCIRKAITQGTTDFDICLNADS